MWVADRGFSSAQNRRELRRGGGHYIIGEKLRSETLLSAIAELPEQERNVIEMRFGAGDQEPQTLSQAGRKLGGALGCVAIGAMFSANACSRWAASPSAATACVTGRCPSSSSSRP